MRGHFRAVLLAAVLGLALTPAAANATPPTIDDMTSGAWIGTYGECGYVLGAYDNPFARCETVILDGTGVVPPNCVNYSPASGGSQDVLDCEYDALDMDGNGDQDIFYKIYTSCSVPVLNNPDGTQSAQNSLWFNGAGGGTGSFDYTIAGVPAGNYRLAVYVMSWDSTTRDQNIQVCVGASCSGADAVGNHQDGVYQLYDVNVAAGETVKVIHTSTAGANAVAQGVFFTSVGAAPGCANGKACSTWSPTTSSIAACWDSAPSRPVPAARSTTSSTKRAPAGCPKRT